VIDVARLGHPDDRVDEQVGFELARGPERQLQVRAVQRIPCLERDDPPPAEFGEARPQRRGRQAERDEVVVHRKLDSFQLAADVPRVRVALEVSDGRMLGVIRAEDRLGLPGEVRLPDLVDVEHGQCDPLQIAQEERRAGIEPLGRLLIDIERDRDRPERAVGQAHVLAHAVAVALRHKAGQRRKAAVEDQFEVAGLPRRERPRRRLARENLEFIDAGRLGRQVDKNATVRLDKM